MMVKWEPMSSEVIMAQKNPGKTRDCMVLMFSHMEPRASLL